MDIDKLTSLLDGLPVPHVRYFDITSSTNDEALRWTAEGAEDGCLVVADQQTQGRGRLGRRWVTQPGVALAFSLILHPKEDELRQMTFFSPLGALAISQSLEETLDLNPLIKWPNDVLLERRKVAGILVEAAWMGDQLQGVVIGIGINVQPAAVPPADQLLFPAISIEEAAGRPVDRLALLRSILDNVFYWRSRLQSPAFRQAWETRLAFKGEWVRVEESSTKPGDEPLTGQVVGLDGSGNLLLRVPSGETLPVAVGDVHLRLID
jgi:BirA family transcriptional regulator, biotin operon repressor / biotin---[acetyl-CoA-carboxylase] ligase